MPRQSTRRPSVALDADDRIALDLTCLTCGYNLRSRRLTGICPECGDSVWNTAYVHFVGDTRWLKCVNLGASLLILSVLVLMAGLALALFGPRALDFDELAGRVVGLTILGAFCSFLLLGLAFLSARDPLTKDRHEGLSVRRSIWICLVAAGTMWLVLGGFVVYGPPSGPWFPPLLPVVALALSLVLLPALVLRHLANLLVRSGSRGTPGAARVLSLVFPACALLLVAATYGPSPNPACVVPAVAAFVLAVSGLVLVLVFTKAELVEWLRRVSQR